MSTAERGNGRPAEAPGPFDVEGVARLAALMAEHALAEVRLRRGDASLCLRRAPAAPAAPAPTAPAAGPGAAAAPGGVVTVKSPTMGTFYDRERPDAAPFVRPGSRVGPNTVVGLVEALSICNEVQAECAGVVVKALVESGQPVEHGAVLFEVDASG